MITKIITRTALFALVVLLFGVQGASAVLTLDATSLTSDGVLTLTGAAGSAITIGAAAQTGTISIGSSTGAMTLNLGTGNSAKTINVGTGTDVDTINIGTGATGADVITIGGGVGTLAINTGDWDISTTGVMTGIGAITADGLMTGTAGLTITGAAVNLNASSNFAVNIGTGSSTGAISIGGNSNTVAIDSSDWDITTAGVMTGIGAITSDGTHTFSGVATDITTGTNEALTLTPDGTGDLTITIDNDSNIIASPTFTGTSTQNVFSSTITNQTTSGAQQGIVITNADDAANAVTEALITLDNLETTASTLTDAILITSNGAVGGVVDAIDVSAINITNAINIGANAIAGTSFSVTDAGAVSAASLNLGTSALLDVLSELTASIDLASAAANTCVTATDAVTNSALGNSVMVQPSADDAAWDIGSLTAFVETAGTVKIVYCNNSAGASDPAAMTYRLTLLQF